MFIFGFIGCIYLRNYLGLGLVSFFFFVITFNFYGGFISKISAYGPSQLGYYLSPYIILILIKFNEERKDIFSDKSSLAIYLSICLAGILFLGSLHIFVQWVTFIIIWGLFNTNYYKHLFLAAACTILICMVRILPAAIISSGEPNSRTVFGYGLNPEFFIQTFISIRGITDIPAFTWWEFSNYISSLGFIMLLIFGIVVYFFKDEGLFKTKKFIFPLIFICLISFLNLRSYLIPNFIPLLNIESLTTRYFFLVVIFILLFASFNFDKFYKSIIELKQKILIWFFAFVHYLFLSLNMNEWSLSKIQQELLTYGTRELEDNLIIKNTKLVINTQSIDQNEIYVYSFVIGLVITLLSSFIIMVYLIFQKSKNS